MPTPGFGERLASVLKEKKIKPSDLVKASIEKAKENQETYNAFVTILEEALELKTDEGTLNDDIIITPNNNIDNFFMFLPPFILSF